MVDRRAGVNPAWVSDLVILQSIAIEKGPIHATRRRTPAKLEMKTGTANQIRKIGIDQVQRTINPKVRRSG